MKEILFADDVFNHKDRDYTWEMDITDIEDEIKKLQKQIHHLKRCRKKQPKLIMFRKAKFGTGRMEAHVLDGWYIVDVDKRLFRADNWHPITDQEAEQLKKKYKLTDEALKVIDDTLKDKKDR